MEGARAEAGRTVRRPLKKSRTRWTRTVVGRGGEDGFSSNSGSKISKTC